MAARRAAVDSLDRPELAVRWTAIRKRLENNGITITKVPLKLKNLDDAEVAAICTLLGRRRPAANDLNVDLSSLDELLASPEIDLGLIHAVEAIGPPLRDRKGERLAKETVRLDLWEAAGGHPAARLPTVIDWLGKLKRTGRLTRLDGNTDTLSEVLDAVRWLVVDGADLHRAPIPLSTLASVRLGDAHALDSDTVVGSLLAEVVCHIAGTSDSRQAWGHFGVQLDQVSTSALALRLPGLDGSICAAATAGGQPLRITWRMLEHGFGLDERKLANSTVHVCENPAVIAMSADRHGSNCSPLVCTEGMPASVTGALLGQLAGAGAHLLIHTDFDHGGLAIARYVMQQFGATPWRMGTDDYLAAISGPSHPLAREAGATDWDPVLASAMNQHGRSVHEEAIVFTLLDDLDSVD